MGFFHILKVYIMYRKFLFLAAIFALHVLSIYPSEAKMIASPKFTTECCDKVSEITHRRSKLIDESIYSNTYEDIEFDVDNSTDCFDAVRITPSVECPQSPASYVLPISSGVSHVHHTIQLDCCGYTGNNQTARLEFMKNGVVICSREIVITCPTPCCAKISTIIPQQLPPPNDRCHVLNFSVDNRDNCFDSYELLTADQCHPISNTSGSIPTGVITPVGVQVCICCDEVTLFSNVIIRFLKNGKIVCTKQFDLPCGDPFAKRGNNETHFNETINTNISVIEVHPNPTSGNATISYQLTEQSIVTLALYDIQGNKILDLENGLKKAGTHTAEAKTHSLPNGSYLIKLNTGEKTYTVPLTVSH
jgi:hypothetical protein